LARNLTRSKFEDLLREAVDKELFSLGESAKQAIRYYLEKGFILDRQEIPYRVKDFATAIEKFFGVGATFLETIILKQLYEKVGENFRLDISANFNFIECVATVKQRIESQPAEIRR
jgi:hypothetical protein